MNDQPTGESFIQASRLLRIETPLGEDSLLLERFEGREAVNELFSFKATVRAKRDDVKPQDLIGKNVQISLTLGASGARRKWDCLVTGFVEHPRLSGGLRQYTLVLHADHWLMTQRSDSRIWQEMTSVEVAETLFSEHGLRAPDTSGVLGAPPKRVYSVQWQETDLAFLLRRIEEDGLFYWVRQTAEGQQFVLADSATRWDIGADGEKGATRFALGSTDKEHIAQWDRHVRFTPGRRAGRDWNFETPNTVPAADSPSLVELPRNGAYELYEYPARAENNASSEQALKLRMQSVEADHERIEANSSARDLAPGAKVTPYDVADAGNVFETAVVLAIEHYANATTFETGGEDPVYENRFEALPARLPATPHRATPKPKIARTQIAIVAGPPGEEIHTDQYGRIKLWFPWDRRAKKDGSDTTWARCIQSWGGAQWGQQVIPRIGMEVAVTYVDDDPDRPLVVGVVPNPVNAVPYGLPEHKTKSVIRSNTHKGEGYNELSFEDERGRENLFLHAQKDMTEKVLNNRAKRVDANETASIGANRSVEVANNQKHEIGGSMSLTVGALGGVASTTLGAGLASLSGQTSGLLQQAVGAAVAVMGTSGPDGDGGASRSVQTASAAMGGTSGSANPEGVDGAGPGPEALVQMATSFSGLIGSGVIGGLLSGAVDAARGGLNAAPRPDMFASGGAGMAGAGSQLAGMVGQMMGGMGGILNTTASRFQNNTTGIAATEQVGMSKVTNVGVSSIENVGKLKRVVVGEEYVIEVGKSKMVMRADGRIILKGVDFHFEAEGPFQQIGKVIDLN